MDLLLNFCYLPEDFFFVYSATSQCQTFLSMILY